MSDELLKRRKKDMSRLRPVVKVLVVYFLLVLLGLLCAGPFLWLLGTSLKSGQNIYDISLFIKAPTLQNYSGVMSFMPMPRYMLNTIIITGGGIIIDIVFSSLCAYPLAHMKFWGKRVIFGALISTMILPCAAGLVVNYLTISRLGLLDKYMGAVLPGAVSVFSIILIRQAYLSIPKEMIEAAKIDGASELRIWYGIMLPEIMPVISTVIIFDFISKWNAFLWPIIVFQDPAMYPVATALKYLMGQFNYKFGYIAAGTVLSVIPVIAVFVAFQKYFVNTIAGAVKG